MDMSLSAVSLTLGLGQLHWILNPMKTRLGQFMRSCTLDSEISGGLTS